MRGVKHNITTAKDRILNTIRVTEQGCWEWSSSKNKHGYGRFVCLGQSLAHRVSYIVFHGPLFKNMFVLHKCDNPPCVNPDHLFIGTQTDNMKDCYNKGRNKVWNRNLTHCRKGHEFTPENTLYQQRGRWCRTCREENARRYYQNKKNKK